MVLHGHCVHGMSIHLLPFNTDMCIGVFITLLYYLFSIQLPRNWHASCVGAVDDAFHVALSYPSLVYCRY